MAEQTQKGRYCFDTSAFINGWRRYYPPKSFSSLWNHFGVMMQGGSIVCPEEVGKEIGVGKDELLLWFKQYKECLVPISKEQLEIVSKIVNKYPRVSDYKKPKPYSADTFVIAVAKIEGRILITDEKPNKDPIHPRIPDMCREYGVECWDLLTFFEKEGITFSIK
jgi:hypothetical protein